MSLRPGDDDHLTGKRMNAATLALLAAIGLTIGGTGAARAAPPATTGTAANAIRDASAAFVASYNAGDGAAVVAHFEADAVVMPPGAPPVQGQAAIREFVAKGIAGAHATGITLALGATNDIGVAGDLAWHAGPYSIVNKAGAVIDTGKYLETWHKSAGRWRIVRRIWNSNTPAAPAPVAPR
jgi:ketosteroid isomerase-like protein